VSLFKGPQTLKMWLSESLGIELGTDRYISVDSSLTHDLREKALADKHSMLGRTKQRINKISEDLYTEKTI